MSGFAAAILLAVAVYLFALAAAAFWAPAKASAFLETFASSAYAHYLEQAVRLVAAAGFLAYAPHTSLSAAFRVLGWVLLITTVMLLAMPWHWHRRFAAWAVPFARRHLTLYGLGSLALGSFIIYGIAAA